jgi:DNA ligase-1
VKAFAALLDALAFTPARNAKLRLLQDYFRTTPDPDRGYALAAMTGTLELANAKPAVIRDLVAKRVDPVLFEMSYDYVGDLAETVALIWQEQTADTAALKLGEVITTLEGARRADVPRHLEGWLDRLDAEGRWALLKLITGALRVGVSARLAKTALAALGKVPDAEVEELWHSLRPPYVELFAWLDGRAPRPTVDDALAFRPFMLANPLEEHEAEALDVGAYRVEWKWDGIRVQLAVRGMNKRLYSRSGDDITGAFPDLLDGLAFDAVLDGELLVIRDGNVAPFNDLQQRLNRKTVTPKMLREYPVGVKLYDALSVGGEDLRPLAFDERRRRLEEWFAAMRPPRLELSPLVAVGGLDDLQRLRAEARGQPIEGLMLKRGDSAYVAGRPKGPWFKWKRDPLTVDAVLMYAQRGHGKRSSFYSDYTFGTWRTGADGGDELVPVGKAYFGFTDDELKQLDRWVRNNTVDSFGPVRQVRAGLVFEVAFDGVQRSTRHKSGVALRFPRISRIRWDKPPNEADRLSALEALIEG